MFARRQSQMSELLDLQDWVTDSNDALSLNIIKNTLDSKAGKGKASAGRNLTFKPLYTYVMFGDEEKIFG